MIRIVGGEFGGRRIATPPGRATRPATSAQREAVMNSLHARLDGARVLDAFAGSGAFGIEALSRGAAWAVFVDLDRHAVGTVRANLATLGVGPDRALVIGSDVYRLTPPGEPFDVVFVAPPYPHFKDCRDRVDALLQRLARRIVADALVLVQSDAGDFADPPPPFRVERVRKYGRTEFTSLVLYDAVDQLDVGSR
jgi:16S rRNA (guanine966-N2)-methyltransferase